MHPDESLFDSLHHLTIEVDDVEDEDLLRHFATTNAFIHSGLDAGGGVLVHWSVDTPIAAAHRQHLMTRNRTPSEGLILAAFGCFRPRLPHQIHNHVTSILSLALSHV
jgi:hypothetical protein